MFPGWFWKGFGDKNKWMEVKLLIRKTTEKSCWGTCLEEKSRFVNNGLKESGSGQHVSPQYPIFEGIFNVQVSCCAQASSVFSLSRSMVLLSVSKGEKPYNATLWICQETLSPIFSLAIRMMLRKIFVR